METLTIRCERCNEILNPDTAIWLELSNTDGNYYLEIPQGHETQGLFSFGKACSKRQLKKQVYNTEVRSVVVMELEFFERELEHCLTIIEEPCHEHRYYVCEYISPALRKSIVHVYITK